MNVELQELIEDAYNQYLKGDGTMCLTTWMQLDNLGMSPAELWGLFEDGHMPLDIFIHYPSMPHN